MDFFAHQDQARKQTGRLVLLFALGVLAVVACTTLAVWGAFRLTTGATESGGSALSWSRRT